MPAPPAPDAATQAACVKVFAKLPVQLGGLAPRRTDTDSSFVAAWGNPAVVVRCGVARSAVFGTPEAAQLVEVNSVLWQPDPQRDRTVYTTVDRGVAIDVTVPAGADQPLPLLAPAVSALPALCTATDAAGNTGATACRSAGPASRPQGRPGRPGRLSRPGGPARWRSAGPAARGS